MLITYFRNVQTRCQQSFRPDHMISLYVSIDVRLLGLAGSMSYFHGRWCLVEDVPLRCCSICQLSPGRSLGMSLLRFGDGSFLFNQRERTGRKLHNPPLFAPLVPGSQCTIAATSTSLRRLALFLKAVPLHLSGSLPIASQCSAGEFQIFSPGNSSQGLQKSAADALRSGFTGFIPGGGRIFRTAGLKF